MVHLGHMPNLVNTAEAAAALGVSRRQVLRLAARGDLTPTLKLPGRTGAYLFTPEAIAEAQQPAAAQ
jgi:hypothetical protein